MDNNLAQPNSKVEIDPGIKGLAALVLGVLACLSNNGWNLAVLVAYLLLITIRLVNDYRFVAKSLVSYGIIFVFPYLVGVLLAWLFRLLLPGEAGMTGVTPDAAERLLKIFLVWYIGSLYFVTTSFGSVAEMLNQLFRPLNRLGIPVTKYLHMVVWSVDQLNLTVSHFRADTFAQVRQIFSNDQLGIRPKLKELADILADFIVNSLSLTEPVQSAIAQAGLNSYRPKITRQEILTILSIVILLLLFYNPPH